MKICPSCREEFLDHIEMCEICQEKLVSEFAVADLSADDQEISKEALLQGETLAFLEGSLASCREVEKVLKRSKIACAVYPASLECGSSPATLGASCDMKYLLLIRPDDLELAKNALEGQFSEQVLREGQGDYVTSAINLNDDVVTCPACGEVAPLKDGECENCGLFLGVIEQP